MSLTHSLSRTHCHSLTHSLACSLADSLRALCAVFARHRTSLTFVRSFVAVAAVVVVRRSSFVVRRSSFVVRRSSFGPRVAVGWPRSTPSLLLLLLLLLLSLLLLLLSSCDLETNLVVCTVWGRLRVRQAVRRIERDKTTHGVKPR